MEVLHHPSRTNVIRWNFEVEVIQQVVDEINHEISERDGRGDGFWKELGHAQQCSNAAYHTMPEIYPIRRSDFPATWWDRQNNDPHRAPHECIPHVVLHF